MPWGYVALQRPRPAIGFMHIHLAVGLTPKVLVPSSSPPFLRQGKVECQGRRSKARLLEVGVSWSVGVWRRAAILAFVNHDGAWVGQRLRPCAGVAALCSAGCRGTNVAPARFSWTRAVTALYLQVAKSGLSRDQRNRLPLTGLCFFAAADLCYNTGSGCRHTCRHQRKNTVGPSISS